MRNKTITVITTLAAMLGDAQEDLELTNDALDKVRDKLSNAEERIRGLDQDLVWLRNRAKPATTDWAVESRAQLAVAIMQMPESFMAAITYLRNTPDRSSKIALIKAVRNVGNFSIVEAKDLVETFLLYPSEAPGEVLLGTLPNPA